MITTRRMQGVHVDPVRRTARVEAGVKWERVMAAAAEYGLAGMCGSSSDVGVIGYTLGGGLGSFGRKHGFAADHVRSVEMVTADGAIRTVCAESEPELFWAVRGGKGNLGIVTQLEIELMPVRVAASAAASSSTARTPRRCCTPTASGRRRCRRTRPRRSRSCGCRRWSSCREPLQGRTVVHLRYANVGADLAESERLVAPMLAAGRPLLGFLHPMLVPRWTPSTWTRSTRCRRGRRAWGCAELSAETVDALLAAAGPGVEIPLMMVELRQLGGALSRQPQVPNAVAGRDVPWELFVLGPAVPELAQVVPAGRQGRCSARWSRGGPTAGCSTTSVTSAARRRSPGSTRPRVLEPAARGQGRRRPGRHVLLRPRLLRPRCHDQPS